MAIQQHDPLHPGAMIFDTYIEPFESISARHIAKQLGVSASTFTRLLNAETGISPAMAVRLSKVLGGSAESWLTLQENFDLWRARKEVDITKLIPIDFSQVA